MKDNAQMIADTIFGFRKNVPLRGYNTTKNLSNEISVIVRTVAAIETRIA